MHACMHACMHSFIHYFVRSFVRSFILSFTNPSIHSFFYVFFISLPPSIHPSIHPLIHPSIHPSIHISIHSFPPLNTNIHRLVVNLAETAAIFPGFTPPQPPACMAGLGLENRNIPDSAITASTFANSYYRPDQGRLQHQYESGGYGSWVPATSNDQQWFQVNFGDWRKVTRVAIQGRLNAGHWVTKFQLAYSYDGVFFMDYIEDGGQAKVLTVVR